MLQVYLLRHAKSSWDNLELDDIDRPLNKRGMRNAKQFSKILDKRKFQIGQIICSPSKRTTSTYDIISNSFDRSVKFTIDNDIYECPPNILVSKIKKLKKNTLIIGHNPSLIDSINILCNSNIEHFPTCAFAIISFKNNWTIDKILKPKNKNY
tara:strand:+ start:981 stop:1439 length:459 start_codon:yes stop_codon:yes gene_type:complete